jgi:hypothetical protein
MSIAINSPWVPESPQSLVEGEEIIFSMVVPGVTTVTNDATLTMTIHRGNDDKSNTLLSGSMSSSGNIVTLKKLTALVGKNTYVVAIFGTADGILRCLGKMQIDCTRKSQIQ